MILTSRSSLITIYFETASLTRETFRSCGVANNKKKWIFPFYYFTIKISILVQLLHCLRGKPHTLESMQIQLRFSVTFFVVNAREVRQDVAFYKVIPYGLRFNQKMLHYVHKYPKLNEKCVKCKRALTCWYFKVWNQMHVTIFRVIIGRGYSYVLSNGQRFLNIKLLLSVSVFRFWRSFPSCNSDWWSRLSWTSKIILTMYLILKKVLI